MTNRSPQETMGLLSTLWMRVRLAWRLLKDGRVPLWPKILIPAIALAYVLFPFDFLPDVIPVIGELDDLALLALAVQAFVTLSPKYLVEEHLRQMRGGVGEATQEGEVVDGEFVVKSS